MIYQPSSPPAFFVYVCVCVCVWGGGTKESPKVGYEVSLSCSPSPISTCQTSPHMHTIMSLFTACLTKPGCLQNMKFYDLYGKPYKCTVFYTVVARGRSVGLSLCSLKPIFSESSPLPEHHPYMRFDFLP